LAGWQIRGRYQQWMKDLKALSQYICEHHRRVRVSGRIFEYYQQQNRGG